MSVPPSCGGIHRAGDGSYLLKDINGVPFKRVCKICDPTPPEEPMPDYNAYRLWQPRDFES